MIGMKRIAGPLMMITAIGHALVGVILFRDALGAIVTDGVFNAIHPPGFSSEPHFDRIAAFWFLLFSPVLFLLAQIIDRSVQRANPETLKLIGWYLVGIGVVGIVVLPVSGNWLLPPLGAIVLGAAREVKNA